MVFSERFNPNDFLKVIDSNEPMCVKELYKRVGCSYNTAIKHLRILEEKNTIKRVNIIGTRYFYYVRS